MAPAGFGAPMLPPGGLEARRCCRAARGGGPALRFAQQLRGDGARPWRSRFSARRGGGAPARGALLRTLSVLTRRRLPSPPAFSAGPAFLALSRAAAAAGPAPGPRRRRRRAFDTTFFGAFAAAQHGLRGEARPPRRRRRGRRRRWWRRQRGCDGLARRITRRPELVLEVLHSQPPPRPRARSSTRAAPPARRRSRRPATAPPPRPSRPTARASARAEPRPQRVGAVAGPRTPRASSLSRSRVVETTAWIAR